MISMQYNQQNNIVYIKYIERLMNQLVFYLWITPVHPERLFAERTLVINVVKRIDAERDACTTWAAEKAQTLTIKDN